ncbi:MAG TPA: RAMP superfamily CRISPR-associated protein, partial [bacterium]|nr:RAMP superfamily CRISPR-associated protein [bacterium]
LGWLGGHSGQGNGWFHLKEISEAFVNSPETLLQWLEGGLKFEAINVAKEQNNHSKVSEYALTITLDGASEGYGREGLLVGSSDSVRWLSPPTYLDMQKADESIDIPFARSLKWSCSAGKYTDSLFIPGSAIRGPLRAAAERIVGMCGFSENEINSLFGTTEGGGRLKIRDAFTTEQTKAVPIFRHAEDEVLRSTCDGALFSEETIFDGSFTTRLVIIDPKQEDTKILEALGSLAECGFLPVGAHGGTPKISIEKRNGGGQ